MQTYEVVGGTLRLPAGSVARLSGAQFADRRQRVETLGKPGKDGAVRIKAREPLHFKAGERIELEAAPDKAMLDVLQKWVDPAEAAARVKAEAERAAATQRLAEVDAARKRVDDAIDAENKASDALDRLKASSTARAEEIAAAGDALAAATAEVEAAEKALDALGTA